MKIQQPSENSLYVTIGGYVYYFDASIEGEYLVERWTPEDDKDNYATETLQFTQEEQNENT